MVKVALRPGRTELCDLARDPSEVINVADQHPDMVQDLDAHLLAYATEQKPSQWVKAQPAFVGEQGKAVVDPDFDISDSGLPGEKPKMPAQGDAVVWGHTRPGVVCQRWDRALRLDEGPRVACPQLCDPRRCRGAVPYRRCMI